MSENSEKTTDKQIAQWQEELDELELNCSTGKIGTPQEQKQKINALLDRARARKQRKLVGG